MAITDLTNTVWEFTSLPSYATGSKPYLGIKNVNFYSNKTLYSSIAQSFEEQYEIVMSYGGASSVQVFNGLNSTPWVNNNYKTVNIIGGADVADSALITFLETYATNRTSEYLTNNSEIASIADAIRIKGSTSSLLTYPDGFITAINNLPTGATLQSKTVNPSTASQTVSPDSGYDGLSQVTVNAMPSGTAGTPTATKGTVSNHSIAVTPKVTNTTGYITGGTKSGTAVTVSASELVSGTKSITENGTGIDVTNYAAVDVNVSGGSGGASNYVHGKFTTKSTAGVQTVTIPYTGSGYPIMAYVVIKGGAYVSGTDWYNSVQRYAVGVWSMSKSIFSSAPNYNTATGDSNYAVVCAIFKNSTTNSKSYMRTSTMNAITFGSLNATNAAATCVRFKGNSKTLTVYVNTSSYGLLPNQDYEYFIVYSS